MVVSAKEQALGREFIRLAHTRLRLIEDPLLVNGVARIGARLTQVLNVDPGIIGFIWSTTPRSMVLQVRVVRSFCLRADCNR
ncbi:MAG: hypothetical protein CM1200mP18_12710 [Gammaproteobacteria bacterium]|nr:MAG: hypothetical protein CM1200mP18_12710 [Gammaproteobacteria bacterium]